jgi:hypothetical protein
MSQLKAALRQTASGPKALGAWLEQNPDALTPQFVDEVKQYATEATQNGAGNAALTAHLLAASIQIRIGDRAGFLGSQLNQAEVQFMMANTSEAYEDPFNIASGVIEKALQIDAFDKVFWAIGLASDCAYFASETAQDSAAKEHWLVIAVDTLLRLEDVTPPKDAPVLWQRFVSVLVAIYQTIIQHPWQPDISVMEPRLRKLAALAERLIPVPFTFQDPQKTQHVVRHLSELSKNYGSVAAAEARLKGSYQVRKTEKWGD